MFDVCTGCSPQLLRKTHGSIDGNERSIADVCARHINVGTPNQSLSTMSNVLVLLSPVRSAIASRSPSTCASWINLADPVLFLDYLIILLPDGHFLGQDSLGRWLCIVAVNVSLSYMTYRGLR